MYDQILKFGAEIVFALIRVKSPVLVYIPPGGELRGGAWAVVDPTINPRYIEMYADSESRLELFISINMYFKTCVFICI